MFVSASLLKKNLSFCPSRQEKLKTASLNILTLDGVFPKFGFHWRKATRRRKSFVLRNSHVRVDRAWEGLCFHAELQPVLMRPWRCKLDPLTDVKLSDPFHLLWREGDLAVRCMMDVKSWQTNCWNWICITETQLHANRTVYRDTPGSLAVYLYI